MIEKDSTLKLYRRLTGLLFINNMFVIYCRIADKTKETKQMLQEEIDDREGFNTEAVQTVDWPVVY